ncbi:MAG: IS110 family transposase [Candidatus Hodarchaeota archaeon]
MEFARIDTEYYCMTDLHSDSLYATVMDKSGKIHFRKRIENNFDSFKNYMTPFMDDLAVGVESTYNWYWLGDGCHDAGIPFYLGHALYMKAITGGKKKNDRLDSKIGADLMRTNFFPLAYAYPRQMRSARDLLRRRNYFVILRAALYSHILTIFAQEAVLDVCTEDLKKKPTRRQLIERVSDTDLQLSLECDLDSVDAFDPIINKLEKRIINQAKHHDHKMFALLETTPGIGDILALTFTYEIHKIDRFPSVQKFSSYSRVVRCDRSSNGKKTGGGNPNIGNPYLNWALHQIIVRAQKHSPLIRTYFQRLVSKHGPRKARSIIAHKFAVAIYYMLKNGEAFDEVKFVQSKFRNKK